MAEKQIVWFWPTNDRASMHARRADAVPRRSLCGSWIEDLGESVVPPSENDSRPVCKRCRGKAT